MVIGVEAVSVTFEAAMFAQETIDAVNTWSQVPDFAALLEFVHILTKDITMTADY